MKKLILSITLGLILASCSIVSPITATNNPIGDKVGKSESICLFYIGGNSSGLVLNGDYGVVEAAKNGNISKIATIDLEVKSYFFFTKNILIVTGE